MARPVITEVTEIRGFGIRNEYLDGTNDEHVFYEGDIIPDFKFASNNEYTKMSCKVRNVKFSTVRRFPTKKYVSEETTTKNLGSVSTLIVDGSRQYESNLKGVEARSILEYEPTKEVKKVSIFAELKVRVKVTLSDETFTEAVLHEGMQLDNVVLQLNGNDIKGSFKLASFFYEMVGSTIKLVGMYLKGPVGNFKVSFNDIKKIGSETTIIDAEADFNAALSDVLNDPNKYGVTITAREIDDPVTITSSVSITGNQALTAANDGDRKTDEIGEDETVFKGKFNFSANTDVTITGVTFTENAKVDLKGASSLTLKNCKFTNITPEAGKNYMIIDTAANQDGLLVQIDGCYFGTNIKNSTGNMYNLFEFNSKIKDGSYIKNCYFAKEVCTHNIINLYNVCDDTTITIENNHFECSMNACRIGFKGAPNNVTVLLNNNVYDETDSYVDYGGLLIVQPYNALTTSMEGVTIKLNNNRYTGDVEHHLFYIYFASSETDLSVENRAPKIYVDGILADLTFQRG